MGHFFEISFSDLESASNIAFFDTQIDLFKEKKALSCELFYCWPQINKILPITVHGHNLQKDYYICRQKLLGWDRTAEGVLC